MKLLWISPTPSHPQDAGNRAHFYKMGQTLLNEGHHVTFMLYGQERVTEEAKTAMRQFWPEFFFIPHRHRERKKTGGNIWNIDDWFSPDLASAIELVKQHHDYNIIYVEYIFFSKALEYFPTRCLKVLSCTDRMSGRADILVRNGIEPDFFYTSVDQEKRALDRADLILAIQQEERDFFQSLTNKPVLEVNYPVVRAPVLPREYVSHTKLRIGYIGSANSLNKRSLADFIYALEQRQDLVSKIAIIVAGNICDWLNADCTFPIEKMGTVASESEFYQEIDLAINPMIDGTGLKIKTVAAIQHGVPFLSTVAGSNGLPVTFGEHKCSTIEELVWHISELVSCPSKLTYLRNESLRLLAEYEDRSTVQRKNFLRCLSTVSTRHIARKRIVAVTDIAFWEQKGGSHARLLTLFNELKRHSNLVIFFLGSMWKAREDAIRGAGYEGMVVSYKSFEEKGKSVTQKSSFPRTPGLARWRHDIFFGSFYEFLRTQAPFDVALFEYVWVGYMADALSGQTLKVLDSIDLMSHREYLFSYYGMKPSVSLSLSEEKDLLERFDVVLAIQHEEAEILSQILENTIVMCCPHGVTPTDSAELYRNSDNRLSVGFMGTHSDANFAAIDWFIRQVWPAFSGMNIILNVYGSVCDRLHNVPPGVVLHGYLTDVNSAYKANQIMINPIIQGGGIKIKSIEALANSKGLIASPEGAIGILDPETSGVVLAKSRAEFIDSVLSLYYDSSRVEKLCHDASTAARNQFAPDIAFMPLISLIREL